MPCSLSRLTNGFPLTHATDALLQTEATNLGLFITPCSFTWRPTNHACGEGAPAAETGRAQGVPLTAWLRVPLTWFQSQTYAYYPDETHATIRRTFSPLHAPHTQRNFCGYCGTPMTFWTESPQEEADFMSVSLGSLFGDDLRLLEDLDLLPEDATDESFGDQTSSEAVTENAPEWISSSSAVTASNPAATACYRHGTLAGVPWFEEMIQGSRLGRIMSSRRGIGVSEDQSTAFEWEISEWHSSSDTGRKPTGVLTPGGNGKRKADDMVTG
ncbi:hypothetical protein UA08_01058 [Talaromyces atroroseus]|uniref:CENP-V/GFA domain-containing protein n=1 Tax=Talaromyces atroroseus TaxID=1441469 RepID=A0A225B9B4_TALAT|nr:hypothetical protein UA08_01058 [Talaromyces atroroseus]OKL64679.1 hypothetical protein UA08_01058 [Talaromyces atroroseus]